MGFKEMLKNIFGKNEVKKDAVEVSPAKMPIDFAIPTTGDIYNVPILSFPINMLYQVSQQSDVVTTIVRAITDEVFRNGLIIKERFKTKCVKCGAEFEDNVPICSECGGLTRKPDFSEKKRMKEWLENYRNSFNEDLITVLKQIDDDVNRIDNGFLLLRKEYYYSDDGRLIGFKVKDIVRASPMKMRLIISGYGIGRGKNGEYFYVCPEHRDQLIEKDKEGVYFCPKCGKQLLPAWFASRDKGNSVYYAKDEVYHVKRWSQTQGYGIPTILPVITKVLILMKMDRFILTAYSLQRSPKGLLIIRGRIDAFERAWEQLKQKAMENPNMITPLVIEGADNSKRIAEYIDFSLKPEEMQWVEMRNELRKQIGARYGVQPLFQGDLSVGAGLNNEGLQITVTNRTIATSQEVWNRVLDWLSKQLGYMDWKFELAPNEEKDMKAQIERERMRIENARIMKDLGYEPILVEGEDGIAFVYRKANTSGSSNTSINIKSIRQMLREDKSGNEINEVEGSPEGRGKRAYSQNYEGSPQFEKEYTTNKVKVRVVRQDGVQQSYYVSRDRLRSFIAEHEAKGQKVIVESDDNFQENLIGSEILTNEIDKILEILRESQNAFDELLDFLKEKGVDDRTAIGISTFAYIIKHREDLLDLLIRDFHGKPIKPPANFDNLRGVVTNDIIEMWKKSVSDLFVRENGIAILSKPIDSEIAKRIEIQRKNGSEKYVHDKAVMRMFIGEKENAITTKAKNNVLYFNSEIAIIDCADIEFDFP